MYLDHRLTDAEILRTVDATSSHHLEVVARRLKVRCLQLDEIARLADPGAPDPVSRLAAIREAARRDVP